MAVTEVTKRLFAAVKTGDCRLVALLLAEEPSLLHFTTVLGSWLHVAASRGDIEMVKCLVTLGADINLAGGVAGAMPIHRAASDGHVNIVQYLLAQGAILDVSEPERNPLFGAIHFGHLAVAKVLIDHGIDTRVKYTGNSMTNMDALSFAREWGRGEIANILIAHGT